MLADLYEQKIYKPQTVDDAANLCTRLIPMFENAGIKIIRIGLHSSPELKKNMIAGAFHDSFGEIVKSRFLLNQILKNPPASYEIFVNPKTVSQLKGQQKRNIYFLMEAGYNIKVTVSDKVAVGEIKTVKK